MIWEWIFPTAEFVFVLGFSSAMISRLVFVFIIPIYYWYLFMISEKKISKTQKNIAFPLIIISIIFTVILFLISNAPLEHLIYLVIFIFLAYKIKTKK